MIRKLKFLMIAAIAATALSASSAHAASFHSESSHTILSTVSIGEPVLTVNAGTIRCSQHTTNSTQATATATTVAGTGTLSGCVAFGFVNTTVDLNTCELEGNADTGLVNIVKCTTPATATAFNCWVTFGNQSGLGSVTYTNEGSGKGRTIRGSGNVKGITYTQHSKSFPGCTNGTFTNGTFVGEGIAKGLDTAGNQVGIWKS